VADKSIGHLAEKVADKSIGHLAEKVADKQSYPQVKIKSVDNSVDNCVDNSGHIL